MWLACGGESPVRPNLILVTASGVRANLLSCYGGDADVGGGICALGRPGIRYRWAITHSPYTAASAASLLTSQMPFEHRVTASAATFLRSDHDTLPELLALGGYTTAAFIGEPALNRARKLVQGFSLFDDSAAADAAAGHPRHPSEMTAAAAAWLVAAKPPWFVWIHLGAPEIPGPPEKGGRGALGARGLRRGVSGTQSSRRRSRRERDARIAELRAAATDWVHAIDLSISELRAVLETQSHPIGIVFAGLQSQSFGERELAEGHGRSLALEEIRVPLFWRPPGLAASTGVLTPVGLVDIAPTLARAGGISVPQSFVGRPLRLVEAADDSELRILFAESANQVALIAGAEFYVRNRASASVSDSADADRNANAVRSAEKPAGAGNRQIARLWKEPGSAGDGLPTPTRVEDRRDGRAARLEVHLSRFERGHPPRGVLSQAPQRAGESANESASRRDDALAPSGP